MKNLFKKSMSVFLAILMLLSCWVFVPGEHHMHAEAAITNTGYATNDKYDTPYWTPNDSNTRWMLWGKSRNASDAHLFIRVPKTIYLDLSETLQSAGYKIETEWSIGNGTDYRMGIGPAVWGYGTGIKNGSSGSQALTMINLFNSYGNDVSLHANASINEVYGYNGYNDSNNYDLRLSDNYSGNSGYIVVKNCGGTSNKYNDIYLLGSPKQVATGRYSTTEINPSPFNFYQQWSGSSWQTKTNAINMEGKPNSVSEQHTSTNGGRYNEVWWDIVIYDKSGLNNAKQKSDTIYNQVTNYSSFITAGRDSYIAQHNATANLLKTREIDVTPENNPLTNQINALSTAANGLRFSASNTTLITAINNANAIKNQSDYEAKYSKATRDALETALNNADKGKAVTSYAINFNDNSTWNAGQKAHEDQVKVNNLTNELNNAMTALTVRTYDVNFENMFFFSDWVNSASGKISTANKGTMTYDTKAGTITFVNDKDNGQPDSHDHYSSYGCGNGHYNIDLEPNEEYVFEYTTSGGTGDQVHIFFYDDNGNGVANNANRGNPFANASGSGHGKSTLTFIAPENATKAAFRFGSTVLGDTVTFSNIRFYNKTRIDKVGLVDWTSWPESKAYDYNAPLGNTLPVPSRPGYTFARWYSDDNKNNAYDDSEAFTDANGEVLDSRKGLVITQNWNLYSDWTPNKYNVIFDNLINFSKWDTTAAGDAKISNVTEDGFTLTSNSGAGEGTSTSPFFPVEAGKEYQVDIDITGDNWDVYIFFCDKDGNWIDFNDGPTNRYSSNGSTGVDKDNAIFTAPDKAEVVKAQIRVDANGSNNTVTFDNIRVKEAGVPETDPIEVTYTEAYGELPVPVRTGYTFNGWVDEDGNEVNKNSIADFIGTKILYSKWTPTKYTVVWKNGDDTLETDENVPYGTTPEYNGETPEKAADAQYTYTFDGWDSVIDNETLTITNTAKFTSVIRTYTVTWKNDNGMNLTTSKVAYGETPVYNGATPTKAGNAQYTYTFSGWSPALAPVTGDAEYTATFTETLNNYTVTWKNWDGTVLETNENVPYGTMPEYDGKTPTRDADKSYTYAFGGWSPAITTVTGDITYTALFNPTQRVYTIIWDFAGEKPNVEAKYLSGVKINVAENTTKEPDATNHYTYVWSPEIVETAYADATYTEVLETEAHIWGGWTETEAPTCTAEGTKERNCTVCGYKETGTVAKLDHSYTSVVTAPTCTDKGYTTHTCSKCSHSYVDTYVDALGHTEETITGKAATCTEPGLTDGKKCSTCGVTTVAQETIPAKGHTEATREENRKEATCGADGSYDLVTYCSVCTTVIKTENKTILATGNHTLGDYIIDKAATCITAGSKHKECENCDYVETEVISATGVHVYGDWEPYESEEGTIHRQVCTADKDCSAFKEEDCYGEGITFAPIENNDDQHTETCKCGRTQQASHAYGNWAADPENTDNNQGKMSRTCSECNFKQESDCTYEKTTNYKTPTCTEEGYQEWECTDINCTNGYTEILEASGHSFADTEYSWSEDNTTCIATRTCERENCKHSETANATITSTVKNAATCTEKGTTTYTATFAVDWATEQTKDVVDIAALGHEWTVSYSFADDGKSCTATRECGKDSSHNISAEATISSAEKTPATCTEKGTTTYTATFTTDGNWAETQTKDVVDIAALGHAWKATTYSFADDGSTCTATRECTRNAEHTETATATIKSTVKIAATCEEKGTTTYTATFAVDWATEQTKDVVDISALGHNFGEATYNFADDGKSCTATRVCKNDATHIETATATITSEVTTPATCTEKGTTTYTATFATGIDWVTAQSQNVQDIHALKHDWDEATYNFAADGKSCTATRVCKNDATHIETATATITSKVTTPATCTVMGITTYTATFTETWAATQTNDVQDVPALNHDWAEAAYSWTKGEDGKWICTATRTCKNDTTHVETANATITSTVKNAATCTVMGTTTYTAKFDVDWAEEQTKDVVDIAALGHEWTVSYSFADDGKSCTATRECGKDSSHNISAEATISSAEKTPATCTEKGTTTYTATFTTDGNWAETQTKDVVDIAALGHNNKVHHKKVDATCVETGTIEYWSCPDCGKNFSDEACTSEANDLTISMNDNHVGYNTEVSRTPSTCNTKGSVTMKCACGDEKTTELGLDANNHESLSSFEAKAATCTEAGYEAYEECSACEYTTFNEIPATGHTEYNLGYVAPTCTTEGSDGTVVCSVCNVTISIGEIIPKTDHTYMTTPIQIIPATCASGKVTIYKCKFCEATYRVVEQGGNATMPHTIVEIGTVEPTCETAGWHVYFCTTCSTEVEKKIIDPIGHKDEDGDGHCDNCDSLYTDPDKQEVCTCLCHKQSGFMKFLYKIAHFIWKLFKINKSCACGVVHY